MAGIRTAEPEMANFAKQQFERTDMAVVATVRRDGSPRISFVQPSVFGGRLYLGMMWKSRKALDLLRDPRVAVHNAICTNTGTEAEITLRGRAWAEDAPRVRARFLEAVAETTAWKEPFHLFSVELESVALIRYDGERGEQSVRIWPSGTAFTRPYG